MNEEMGVGAKWTLRQGDLQHGTIIITDQEFPWLHGSWQPTPSFVDVAQLFAAELRLFEESLEATEDEEDSGAWEAAYEAIVDGNIRLHYPNGVVVPEFLLHIDGATAWFRWSDEAFEE